MTKDEGSSRDVASKQAYRLAYVQHMYSAEKDSGNASTSEFYSSTREHLMR